MVVIKWDPYLGGDQNLDAQIYGILQVSPKNSALFGLVIEWPLL